MKFVLSQSEIKTMISDVLQNRFQSGCKFDCSASPSYGDWTFEEETEQYLSDKAEEAAKTEAYRQKWAAEAKAKEAAATAVDIAAQPGPF